MHLVFARYKDEEMQADFFLRSVLQKPDLPAAMTASQSDGTEQPTRLSSCCLLGSGGERRNPGCFGVQAVLTRAKRGKKPSLWYSLNACALHGPISGLSVALQLASAAGC